MPRHVSDHKWDHLQGVSKLILAKVYKWFNGASPYSQCGGGLRLAAVLCSILYTAQCINLMYGVQTEAITILAWPSVTISAGENGAYVSCLQPKGFCRSRSTFITLQPENKVHAKEFHNSPNILKHIHFPWTWGHAICVWQLTLSVSARLCFVGSRKHIAHISK